MLKSIKSFAVLAVVMGLMVGCSSNKPVEQDPNAGSVSTDTSGVGVQSSGVDVDGGEDSIADLATVFYFEFDSAVLLPEARAALIAHAEYARNSSRSVRLEGHADERGSREYNMALGERRANAVRDFLVLQGVSSSSIETVSYGEERPAVSGSGESSWSKNRRVELFYR
ncbi:peptidoglycan-associated lipoprotein Pal [Saccharophagus sp. K07]|uniref:peptidoglycan-associated lipoprotein Pal n=1 Tax=Saccharophagus sp. K07 TaxID=2283636 RepID=UPI0016525D8D|nr:peptidoglycan-associated lipoprotein Pal [Saccharophagus sp. K07]MBC6903882.1 peptidoglycan-associated lipoprotein Pal [Saccharophagus sp. K07]